MRKHLFFLLALLLGSTLGTWAVAPTANAASCTDPKFVTTDPNGMWGDGKYIVHNNMWNASSYRVSERLSACSFRNWKVTATADNRSGDGAVKTYPNVHVDYHDWGTGHEPRITAFKRIRSSFAMRSPGVGIYDVAYDIWLNGVPGNREIMFWTDNHRQVPSGRIVARGVTFAGRTWKVWASQGNSTISFVPTQRMTHGTINIKRQLLWLMKRGMIQRGSTLGQICYGVEVVSTGGSARRFKVDEFKVDTVRK